LAPSPATNGDLRGLGTNIYTYRYVHYGCTPIYVYNNNSFLLYRRKASFGSFASYKWRPVRLGNQYIYTYRYVYVRCVCTQIYVYKNNSVLSYRRKASSGCFASYKRRPVRLGSRYIYIHIDTYTCFMDVHLFMYTTTIPSFYIGGRRAFAPSPATNGDLCGLGAVIYIYI